MYDYHARLTLQYLEQHEGDEDLTAINVQSMLDTVTKYAASLVAFLFCFSNDVFSVDCTRLRRSVLPALSPQTRSHC